MSWFTKKPKNRRGGNRGHVLDVKLRSDQVRAGRLRAIATVLFLLFATIFGFYLVWNVGEWSMDRLVYENKTFAIKEIDVQTDGVIAPDQLRKWAGVRQGENLLALDLGRVKRDLEMVSLVRSVAVERVLPGTLRLRVSEREPAAQVFIGHPGTNGEYQVTTLHLDEDGYVMALLEPRQRAVPMTETNDALPLVSGINPNQLAPGRQLNSQQVRSALQLIAAFERSTISRVVDLRQVDVSSPEVLLVTTTQGSEITFSSQDFEKQLRRWQEIYNEGQRTSKAIATLDLAVPNYIPAHWTDASAMPPVERKHKNPQRTRRKNV